MIRDYDRSPRGHDLTLLRELQELTPTERISRNCEMVELIEKLRAAATVADETRRDLPELR